MFVGDESLIRERLRTLHSGDREQLEFVESTSRGLVIEAPAGYGKTRSIVSRVAFLLASGMIPWPKRILVMTFSVNAAYKIKRDVTSELPSLLGGTTIDSGRMRAQVSVSNYHGISRSILRKHGHAFHPALKDIDTLESVDDSDVEALTDIGFSLEEAQFASDMNAAVKSADANYFVRNILAYNELIRDRLITKGRITFNAILSVCLQLFDEYPSMLAFYRAYFVSVLIDEAQDTNWLSWSLLQRIVKGQDFAFIGDPLQRIYGFIGALPNVMDLAQRKFGLTSIVFQKNYRFRNNPAMLLLDKNLRANAESLSSPRVPVVAKVGFHRAPNQASEGAFILSLVKSLLGRFPDDSVCVLFRAKFSNPNTKSVVEQFERDGIDYFFALYSDEDQEYKSFHLEALKAFSRGLRTKGAFSKNVCSATMTALRRKYRDRSDPMPQSLLKLLNVFFDRLLVGDFMRLQPEEKINYTLETLENFALKQQLEQMQSKVTVTTVHGAKGLEWDRVIIADLEQYSFPTFPAYCRDCTSRSDCVLRFSSNDDSCFLDELSVFYVASTRAKKEVFYTASSTRITANGREQPANISCLLQRPGIQLVPIA